MLWHGAPHELIRAAKRGTVELCTCTELLNELADILTHRKFSARLIASGNPIDAVIDDYRGLVTIFNVPPVHIAASRDPDDDVVLACAVASDADAVISGDNDLLVLGKYQKFPILRVADVLLLLAGRQQQP
jgi:putative PIN family toxin of toxin-antitoxin system